MIDRDALIEFIETRRTLLIIIAAVFLMVLLIVIIFSFAGMDSERKKKDFLAEEKKARALFPEELWLPGERYPVPGYQYFREPRAFWSLEEVKQWYTVPDEASLGELGSAGRKKVDTLLESVP